VDTPSPITHISLCAGYGGIDLGLARAIPNIRTIAFSEIEAFACANLVSKMEAGLLDCAPIWTDLKTFPWDQFCGKVDIISGGFPCQPFSCAGKRNGDEDPRHLFPYILDGIRRCSPSIVFLENVEGIISSKLNGEGWNDPAGTPVLLHVLRELERVGYKATAGVFSASECSAPHQRKRVFIMAHNLCERGKELTRKIPVKSQYPPLGTAILFADSYVRGSQAGIPRQEQRHEGYAGISDNYSGQVWPSRPGQPQYKWEPPRVLDNNPKTRGGRGELDDSTNANDQRWKPEMGKNRTHIRWRNKMDSISQQHRGADGSIGTVSKCETEPPLGGNPNGTSRGVGYAKLSVSCDNRTDELRLLGNGVVPATAEKAFNILWEKLTN
jgi:DNA (cytosine-5)-methyltransferase 1